MEKQSSKKTISRRRVLPVLGSSFLIPFFGLGMNSKQDKPESSEEEYEILLRSDGSTVKVKKSAVQRSKVKKKNMSNSSLLKWLGKTF